MDAKIPLMGLALVAVIVIAGCTQTGQVTNHIVLDISDLVLSLSDLPEGFELLEQGERTSSDVSIEALNLGWEGGYYAIFLNSNYYNYKDVVIEQAISTYPLENIGDVLDVNLDWPEYFDEIKKLSNPAIGDESRAWKLKWYDDELDYQFTGYVLEFVKRNVYMQFFMWGTMGVDYTSLKEITRSAANKITSDATSSHVQTNNNQTESDLCTPNWQCTEWSECINNQQTRLCVDENNCSAELNKPSELQSCISPVVEPDIIVITGNGPELTNSFHLEKGLTTIFFSHSGDSNFIVDLIDSDGDTIGWGVNEIGEYVGSKAMEIEKEGDYYLNVQFADGDWEAVIRQPRDIIPVNLPCTFVGKGASAENFFYAKKGLYKIILTHDGDSNFIVDVLEEDGSSSGWWGINEIGEFDGSKALKIEETGIYLLYINLADGNWEITIE